MGWNMSMNKKMHKPYTLRDGYAMRKLRDEATEEITTAIRKKQV